MGTSKSGRFVLFAVVLLSACASPSSNGGGGGGGGATGSDKAVWAVPTRPSIGNYAKFAAVAADSSGNCYAVGYLGSSATFQFGGGVFIAGSSTAVNALIVKYDSSGNPLWAATTTSGVNSSEFKGVATDLDGNVYTVGEVVGGDYNFGNGVTVTTGGPVIVKYNSDGEAQWVKTRTSPQSASAGFTSVTFDGSGYLYASGFSYAGTHNFGNGATLTGSVSHGVLVVKYDTAGTAQWARGSVSGQGDSTFNGIAVDGTGSVHAVGYVQGTESHSFGTDITVQGESPPFNPVVVKYTSDGTAQWARTAAGGVRSVFHGVAVSSGGVYVVGELWGTQSANFGNSQTVAGTSININVLLAKYDASGTPVWVRSQSSGQGFSVFKAVAVNTAGDIFAAGTTYSNQNKTIGFGNSVVAKGTNSVADNPLLTKYDASGTPQWTQTIRSGDGSARYFGATSSGSYIYVAGEMAGTVVLNSSVKATDGTQNLGTIAVKYSTD